MTSVALATALLTSSPAAVAQTSVKWDSGGFAEIDSAPFTWGLELVDYDSPKEITKQQYVEVEVSVKTASEPCMADLVVIPFRNGVPVGDSEVIDASDSYNVVSVLMPVNAAGTYQLQITGSVTTGNPFCFTGDQVTVPYLALIDLFTLAKNLPGPASKSKVVISSSGPNTLVANTRAKSSPIAIRFTVTDNKKRRDLLYSICMTDIWDCWIEDAKLAKKSNIRKTANGWIVDWGFWWERTSPSSCLTYRWQQPDVSVILSISNPDGKVIGRKKQSVKLTCRY